MIGLKIGNVAFMIDHLYNSNHVIYYINDALYYQFINLAFNKGSELINWGTIEIDDLGLLRMKKKYGSEIKSTYVLTYRIHLLD